MIQMIHNFNTQLTFSNGFKVSFSIGEGNYCANRDFNSNPFTNPKTERTCKNCEVAVFDQNDKFVPIQQFLPADVNHEEMVAGWVSADDLAKIIQNVANY